MKHLFIDTNIYLRFYHFSSDTLDELNKLLDEVKNGRIVLYITEQVINEFRRNREATISDSLRRFSNQKLPDEYPQMCKAYDEYNQLRDLAKSFSKLKTQLTEKLRADIDSNQCGADRIISGLFEVSQKLEIDGEIVEKARTRVALGNPPGRNNALGDSINWELLLKHMPNNEDLHFVTIDKKDYSSKIDDARLAEFLILEWEGRKNSTIHYYSQLSSFLNREFPNIVLPSDIELESDLEKETAINDFINSVSFKMTHAAIKELRKFKDLTDSQILELVEASITNSQISRIYDDDDVKAFLLELIDGKGNILPSEWLEAFNRIYKEEPLSDSTENDEIQF